MKNTHTNTDFSKIATGLLTAFILLCLFAPAAPAATPKRTYMEADACYRKLLKQPKRQKYRHNWFTCIDQFKKAYKISPGGPWAAASLYRAGQLYLELYKHSYRKSDKQEAVDLFRRIVKRYPKSRYRKKAQAVLRAIDAPSPPPKPTSTATADSAADAAYEAAETCHGRLSNDPKKRKYRHNWLGCIKKYQAAYAKAPQGPRAAASKAAGEVESA